MPEPCRITHPSRARASTSGAASPDTREADWVACTTQQQKLTWQPDRSMALRIIDAVTLSGRVLELVKTALPLISARRGQPAASDSGLRTLVRQAFGDH